MAHDERAAVRALAEQRAVTGRIAAPRGGVIDTWDRAQTKTRPRNAAIRAVLPTGPSRLPAG